MGKTGGNLTPELVEQYIVVMKRHNVQNMQLETPEGKLIVSGIYNDATSPVVGDDDEDALDRLR